MNIFVVFFLPSPSRLKLNEKLFSTLFRKRKIFYYKFFISQTMTTLLSWIHFWVNNLRLRASIKSSRTWLGRFYCSQHHFHFTKQQVCLSTRGTFLVSNHVNIKGGRRWGINLTCFSHLKGIKKVNWINLGINVGRKSRWGILCVSEY